MYFTSISAIAHVHYGDPLLPMVDAAQIDRYLGNASRCLGTTILDRDNDYKPESEEVLPMLDVVRSLNRKLHCLYIWGQERGERPVQVFTTHGTDKARTRDMGVVVNILGKTISNLADELDIHLITVREALGKTHKFLDVVLVKYVPGPQHTGWWVRTKFARDRLVWDTAVAVYEVGESLKEMVKAYTNHTSPWEWNKIGQEEPQ